MMVEKWLIFYWDLPRLRVLRGERQSGRWLIHALEDWTIPDSLAVPGEGRGIAEWLRQESSDYHFEAAEEGDEKQVQAAIIVPRDRATVRSLLCPDMPDEELPAIVPMQMATQLTTRLEDLLVDFLPGGPDPGGGKRVMAAAMPISTMNDFRQFAMAGRMRLRFVGLSSCALQELAFRLGQVSSSHTTLITNYDSDHMESLALQGERQLGSSYRRRHTAGPVTSKELTSDIRRLLSLEEVPADENSTTCLLVGAETSVAEPVSGTNLVEEISGKLGFPVLLPDWDFLSGQLEFSQPEGLFDLSALAQQGGLLLLGGWLAAGEIHSPQVNFVAPREPRDVPDRRRLYAMGGGLAVVLLLGVGWWLWQSKLKSMDNEIDSLRKQVADVETFLRERGVLRNQAANLDQHTDRSLVLTRHWAALSQVLPEQAELKFTSWRAIPISGENHTRVLAKGIATSRQQVEVLAEKLDGLGLTVRSPVVNVIEKTGPYGFEFDLDYDIPPESLLATRSGESPPPSGTTRSAPTPRRAAATR